MTSVAMRNAGLPLDSARASACRCLSKPLKKCTIFLFEFFLTLPCWEAVICLRGALGFGRSDGFARGVLAHYFSADAGETILSDIEDRDEFFDLIGILWEDDETMGFVMTDPETPIINPRHCPAP